MGACEGKKKKKEEKPKIKDSQATSNIKSNPED
jgi:hypothetical protein